MVKVNGAIIGGIISQKFKVIQKNHIAELRTDVKNTIKIPNIPNCKKKIY